MPFVRRSTEGAIVALFNQETNEASEFLPPDDPQICAFLGVGSAESPANDFAVLDAGLIRVVEDLIDVLVAKGLLRLTDLPAPAQSKLLARKDVRRKMTGALNLLGDRDVI